MPNKSRVLIVDDKKEKIAQASLAAKRVFLGAEVMCLHVTWEMAQFPSRILRAIKEFLLPPQSARVSLLILDSDLGDGLNGVHLLKTWRTSNGGEFDSTLLGSIVIFSSGWEPGGPMPTAYGRAVRGVVRGAVDQCALEALLRRIAEEL